MDIRLSINGNNSSYFTMNFKDHLTAGTIVGVSVGVYGYGVTENPRIAVSLVIVGILGGLFPDLDTDSIPARWFARFSSALGLWGFWQAVAFDRFLVMAFAPALVLSLAQSGRHRGWTHSYFIPTIACVLWVLGISPPYDLFFASFALGILSHFALDGQNPIDYKNWIDLPKAWADFKGLVKLKWIG